MTYFFLVQLCLVKKPGTSSSVSLPPSLSSSVPHSRKLNELRVLAPRGTCCSPLPRSKIPRAIMRRLAEWAAGTGNSLPAACKSLFMGVWGLPPAFQRSVASVARMRRKSLLLHRFGRHLSANGRKCANAMCCSSVCNPGDTQRERGGGENSPLRG